MQDFRHIQAWQRGHTLAVAINKATAGFRRISQSELRHQVTRAAGSIADNIAEGAGSSTAEDFARFLDNSIKSANETESQLLLIRDLELLSHEVCQAFIDETISIRKMTYAYRNKVLASAKRDPKRRH